MVFGYLLTEQQELAMLFMLVNWFPSNRRFGNSSSSTQLYMKFEKSVADRGCPFYAKVTFLSFVELLQCYKFPAWFATLNAGMVSSYTDSLNIYDCAEAYVNPVTATRLRANLAYTPQPCVPSPHIHLSPVQAPCSIYEPELHPKCAYALL